MSALPKLGVWAIIEKGERFVTASCPEVLEANGQGVTRFALLNLLN